MNYEIYSAPLPLVQIICRYKNERELLTVIEDCSDLSLDVVLDACENAYRDWLSTEFDIGG